MDDVTSMSIGDSRMGLTHSLDHSIPRNLFIKTGLNSSPAEVEDGFNVRSVNRDSFVGWKMETFCAKEHLLRQTDNEIL